MNNTVLVIGGVIITMLLELFVLWADEVIKWN